MALMPWLGHIPFGPAEPWCDAEFECQTAKLHFFVQGVLEFKLQNTGTLSGLGG